jgi:AbrB family looped-hinge helix DNA binding protein
MGRRERGKIEIVITKVNSRNQITIPQAMLEKLNIKAGDSVLVDVQDGIMVLIPQPKSYTNHLQSLHSEIWETVDIEKYISGERAACTRLTSG